MWEDYSFAEASQRGVCYDFTDDSSSPDSSRGASPLSDDASRRSPYASYSITELSHQFGSQTLQSRRKPPNLRSPPSHPSHLHSSIAKDRSPTAHSHRAIRRKREALIHRQCSATNMAKLSSLVQDLVEDPAWNNDDQMSSVKGGNLRSTLQPSDAPLLSPTSSVMSTSSSSEDSDLDFRISARGQPQLLVSKELKHSSSRDIVGRMHKDVRLRTYVRGKR